jgi:hypothetical protein
MVTKLQVSEPQGQGPGTDPRRPDIAIGHKLSHRGCVSPVKGHADDGGADSPGRRSGGMRPR